MTKDEIAKLLVIAMGIDARLNAADQNAFIAKVEGWALALSNSMTLDFARQAVGKHYAGSTDSLMPAHLNTLWKIERDKQPRVAIDRNDGKLGMPDDVRAKLLEMGIIR